MYNTPILFLVFNRPNETAQVFARIREVKPKYFYIAADGPRNGKDGEEEKCNKVRSLILNNIDWDCEVKTLFRVENLGCGIAVSSAINWFFENVEEGIILEDDCLPRLSFFNYCEKLLEKYKYNDEVMHIGGYSFSKRNISKEDYFFSKYTHVWGWATWKRAWSKYQFEIDKKMLYEFIMKSDFKDNQKDYWINIIEKIESIKTWDYQWGLTVFYNNGYCIIPSKNLINNLGFESEIATHTNEKPNYLNTKSFELQLTLNYVKIAYNNKYDKLIESILVPKVNMFFLFINQVKYLLKKWKI